MKDPPADHQKNTMDSGFFVIQTTEGRKDLECIKWMLPRFFATLCYAQNDIKKLEIRKKEELICFK